MLISFGERSHPVAPHTGEVPMEFNLVVPRDTETVLGGGTYALEGAEFPHPPQNYRFAPYSLPATFGKTEGEEVAARYLALCQQADNWVILDYNVFCRMVGDELVSERIQNGEVFSLILLEMARWGSDLHQWINAVIDVGLHYLRERGFIEFIDEINEQGNPCTLIRPLPQFIVPIERHIATAA